MVAEDYLQTMEKLEDTTGQVFKGINCVSSATGAASNSINLNLQQISQGDSRITQFNYILPDFDNEPLSPADIYCMILGYKPTEITYSLNFQNSAI